MFSTAPQPLDGQRALFVALGDDGRVTGSRPSLKRRGKRAVHEGMSTCPPKRLPPALLWTDWRRPISQGRIYGVAYSQMLIDFSIAVVC